MRICTKAMFAQEIAMLNKQYAEVGQMQMQMSSGRQIQAGSENPLLASRIYAARDQVMQINSYEMNTTLATNRCSLMDSTMNSAVEQLKHVKELVMQASNGTLSNAERFTLGNQISDAAVSLLSLANTQDVNGEYIFGGLDVTNTPFVKLNGSYVYQGSSESTLIDISPNMSVEYSVSGDGVFDNILLGNGTFTISAAPGNTGTASTSSGTVTNTNSYVADTYTLSFVTNGQGQLAYQITGLNSGQVVPPPPATVPANAPAFDGSSDIQFNGVSFHVSGQPNVGDQFKVAPATSQNLFNTLSQLASVLQTPVITAQEQAQLQQSLNQSNAAFDQIFDHIVSIQSSLGGLAKQVDTVTANNDTLILQQTANWSSLANADLAQVATQLMQDMTGLKAAQQTYVKIQELFMELLKF